MSTCRTFESFITINETEHDVTVRYCHEPADDGDRWTPGCPAVLEVYEVLNAGVDVLDKLDAETRERLNEEAWNHQNGYSEMAESTLAAMRDDHAEERAELEQMGDW